MIFKLVIGVEFYLFKLDYKYWKKLFKKKKKFVKDEVLKMFKGCVVYCIVKLNF